MVLDLKTLMCLFKFCYRYMLNVSESITSENPDVFVQIDIFYLHLSFLSCGSQHDSIVLLFGTALYW
jgi:hypothetical protein